MPSYSNPGDESRQGELDTKLERVRGFMAEAGYDAVLLTSDQNFSWIACGGSDLVDHSGEMGCSFAFVLITREISYLVANNIEMPRILSEEVRALCFESVEYPWTEGGAGDAIRRLVQRIGVHRVAADTDVEGTSNEGSRIGLLRTPLLESELDRFRVLCASSGEAMADTIAAIHPGMTEIEIQGVAGCEVLKRGAFPNLILVGSDERISRFRHPVPTQVALKRYCMVVICAQRWGLVSSVTRLVHFGPLPDELSRRYDALLEVEHAIVCATVPGNALSEIFEVARCAYSAAGFDGEEQKHFQGGTCGYYGREQELSPRIPYRIREGEVFAHNPSITGVKLEDTVHTSNGAFEILTEVPEWPVREITREGITLKRPEILIR